MSNVTSVKLDDDLKLRLSAVAERLQRKPHWVMLEAIKAYVSSEEKKAAFYEEGLKSWEEYKQTGRHLTKDEVHDSMKTWFSDNEKTLPECHK